MRACGTIIETLKEIKHPLSTIRSAWYEWRTAEDSLEWTLLQALCGLLCAQQALHWKHVTQYPCRRGPYLPTVPELTHMPLCCRFSRSLKPVKDARRGWCRWSGCLSKSTHINYGRRTGPLPCHILLPSFTNPRCVSQSSTSTDWLLQTWYHSAGIWTGRLLGMKSKHNCYKDFPGVSHPPSLLLFPQLISSETRLHECASRHKSPIQRVLRSGAVREKELFGASERSPL